MEYCVNSLDPWKFELSTLKLILVIGGWGVSYETWLQMNVTGPYWWLTNIALGDGLVPWGKKPLPEQLLNQILYHMASPGLSELKLFLSLHIISALKCIAKRCIIWLVQMRCNFSALPME